MCSIAQCWGCGQLPTNWVKAIMFAVMTRGLLLPNYSITFIYVQWVISCSCSKAYQQCQDMIVMGFLQLTKTFHLHSYIKYRMAATLSSASYFFSCYLATENIIWVFAIGIDPRNKQMDEAMATHALNIFLCSWTLPVHKFIDATYMCYS